MASLLILLAIPVIGRAETALVERVVDGDTVVVRLEGQAIQVRLIGADAPESVDPSLSPIDQ
jgi:micrococcal nuclease